VMLSRAARVSFTEPGPSVPDVMARIDGTAPASKRGVAEGRVRVVTHDADGKMSLALK